MKIGIVCYPSYGGSGVVATELGEYLALRGHEVHFISYDRPFRMQGVHKNLILHEVDVFEYPLFKYPPYSIVLASTIAEVIRKYDLDLIHAHYAIPHTVSAYLARQMVKKHIPIITTLHGTDVTILGNDRQFYDITKFSLEISDAVTTVSESLKRETEESFGIDGIRRIYNFIDPDKYYRQQNDDLRRQFAKDNEKIIMHISNFRPVKRVLDIIKAFKIVNDQLPSKLILVGDGPDRYPAQQLTEDLGLSGQVYFLGKQEKVIPILSIADLFMLPSEKESFGLAALEAMACEVPVVASITGGLTEVVEDQDTGFLASVGDWQEQGRLALKILTDELLHKRMREKARLVAISNFDVNSIIGEYEQLYKSLVVKT